MKKAVIISGNLAQDHEFIYPYYRLLEAGFEVDVCLLEGKPVKGILGTALPPNKDQLVMKIDQINPSIYSFTSLPESKFEINFTLDYDTNKLDLLLPEPERSDFEKHTKFIIKYECKNSRKRGIYNLAKAVSLNKAKGKHIL